VVELVEAGVAALDDAMDAKETAADGEHFSSAGDVEDADRKQSADGQREGQGALSQEHASEGGQAGGEQHREGVLVSEPCKRGLGSGECERDDGKGWENVR